MLDIYGKLIPLFCSINCKRPIIITYLCAAEVRGPGFDTRSDHILSFFLPLIQEEQLSVTGESMCARSTG